MWSSLSSPVAAAHGGGDVVPHGVAHAEVGDDARRRLLGERVGQHPSQVTRGAERTSAGSYGSSTVTPRPTHSRIRSRYRSRRQPPGLPVGPGARARVGAAAASRRQPDHSGARARRAETVPAVVGGAGVGRADELPRALHLDEHGGVAAGVGVRLAQPQPVGLAERLLVGVGLDARAPHRPTPRADCRTPGHLPSLRRERRRHPG